MSDFLPYMSAAGAFVAALLAVVGQPKWDATKTGLRRLTPPGRFAVALATMSLLSTIVLTRSAQRAADEQGTQRERVRRLAHTELRLAIQELADPFVGFLVGARRGILIDGAPPTHTSGKTFPSCMFDATDYALLIAATDPIEPGRQPSTRELLSDTKLMQRHNAEAHRFSLRFQVKRDATAAAAAIDRALPTYAAYLEPNVLYWVSELRRTRWLWQLQNLGPQMPVDFGLLPTTSPGGSAFRRDDDLGYQRFWKLVTLLWTEEGGLFRDGTNTEIWGPDHPLMKQLGDDRKGAGSPNL